MMAVPMAIQRQSRPRFTTTTRAAAAAAPVSNAVAVMTFANITGEPTDDWIGTGIADDKAVYSYMPEIVQFYTGERPILQNVPTWRCGEREGLAYVLDNLADLVVKEVHGSGGYGMLVGPAASKAEIETFRV